MTRGDDVAQSPGPTEPKWCWPAPLPLSTGQSLAYVQKTFHPHAKGGQWSRSVMPKVDADKKLGHPATLASRLA
jgi:hypothetical protein